MFAQMWQEDVYRIQSNPRGICLIVDCVGTEGGEESWFLLNYHIYITWIISRCWRFLNYLSTAHLEQLFSKLHFRVIHHKLLDNREIHSCLEHISKLSEHSSMDAFICCIISRSRSSQLLGTDSYSQGLSLNTIRQCFMPDSCRGLTGKPKLFFIQSYETSESSDYTDCEDGELETDSPFQRRFRGEEVPEDADIFWSHCWTNETQLEDSNHHSVYLQSLHEALVDGQKR